jgi:hypothetical protein
MNLTVQIVPQFKGECYKYYRMTSLPFMTRDWDSTGGYTSGVHLAVIRNNVQQ